MGGTWPRCAVRPTVRLLSSVPEAGRSAALHTVLCGVSRGPPREPEPLTALGFLSLWLVPFDMELGPPPPLVHSGFSRGFSTTGSGAGRTVTGERRPSPAGAPGLLPGNPGGAGTVPRHQGWGVTQGDRRSLPLIPKQVTVGETPG